MEDERRQLTSAIPAQAQVPPQVKDLAVISLAEKWTGQKGSFPGHKVKKVQEAQGNHSDKGKVKLAKIKLKGLASHFVATCPRLRRDITLKILKDELKDRFKENQPLQFHYYMLHNVRQEYNEYVQTFADRCCKLCDKTRLLAAFTDGLLGNEIQQLSYKIPHTMDEAERMVIVLEVIYVYQECKTKFDDPQRKKVYNIVS
ncbi:hypothetical protein PR048_011744 [Dryococelus australis]|uniref:Uncharacterized protein n=1 Tax=Dryococelus australis TaxID=614101 RepID=A0ABQ9HN76_9NEOP|nr:hypothetical protein PR048_011744 [Dryococelus australis]